MASNMDLGNLFTASLKFLSLSLNPIAIELERYQYAFEAITGKREESKKLADSISSKLNLIATSSQFSHYQVRDMLCSKAHRLLAAGVSLSEVIASVDNINNFNDFWAVISEHIAY